MKPYLPKVVVVIENFRKLFLCWFWVDLKRPAPYNHNLITVHIRLKPCPPPAKLRSNQYWKRNEMPLTPYKQSKPCTVLDALVFFARGAPSDPPPPFSSSITVASSGVLSLRLALPFHILELSLPPLDALLSPGFVLTLLATDPFIRRFQMLGKFPSYIPVLGPALELCAVAGVVPVPVAISDMLHRTIHRFIRVPLKG